ncbi:MAG: hypothetical protein ACREPR_18220 [Brasilonema sp.]
MQSNHSQGAEIYNPFAELFSSERKRTLKECVFVFVDTAFTAGYTQNEVLEAFTDWFFQNDEEKFEEVVKCLEQIVESSYESV